MKSLFCAGLLSLFTASLALAQNGDKAGEEQKVLVPLEKIPPAPVLSPADALKTFKLPKGFRIELVASEPLVHNPVQIVFDPDGRLWVLEMRGYMPNADAVGELEKVASVSMLEDTDGDGRMDKRTEIITGLVMPRALALVNGGVLVAEPPKLWFYPLADGKAGTRVEVANDYAREANPKLGARANPEHASNGLLPALDNWIYSANHTTRYRLVDGEWQKQPTAFRGQWGISQDDFGRLVYNSNSDQLRMDLVPSAYLVRNPYYRNPAGLNVQPVKDQAVWPIRVNPGVNRGYRSDQLRPDGTLATYTAACAPVVYRGDNFPEDCRGNVFLCEPAGNLVRRNILTEQDGGITARNAYDRAEFLASTDERFRPVNLATAPDGSLYVVDLYHGIIQHRIYLTSYLRKQAESRGLEAPNGLGRIWRVVNENKPRGRQPQLNKASATELVQTLSHPNGWWRDTAQRLLVERTPAAAIPELKKLAMSGTEPLGRLHALWTLDGMGQLDAATLGAVLKSEQHSKVRAAAIRLTEPLLKTAAQTELLPKLLEQMKVAHPDVQLQLAFTLSLASDSRADKALLEIARRNVGNLYLRDAVLSGSLGRETSFLEQVLADKNWTEKKTGADAFLGGLARSVAAEARPARVSRLLELTAAPGTVAWQQAALLNGIASVVPGAGGKGQPAPRVKVVWLAAEPATLAALEKSEDKSVRDAALKIDRQIAWPGKPGVPPPPVARPFTPEQQARFEMGRTLFESSCLACHQPHGLGQEGLAPPLADSEWVAGADRRLARIVLHGVHGPISVGGRKYDLDMPSFGTFEDAQIAAILTYIRREWGHTYDAVEPATVTAARTETNARTEAWSEEELLKVK